MLFTLSCGCLRPTEHFKPAILRAGGVHMGHIGWFKRVSLILIVVLLAVVIWFKPMIFLPAFLSVLQWIVNNLLALVVAIATVSLTIITWKYVKLTHALVGLQIE